MQHRTMLLCLMLAACGPEVATTDDSSGTTTTATTSTDTTDTTATSDPPTGSTDPSSTTTAVTTTGATSTTDATTGDESSGDVTTGAACLAFETYDPREFPDQPKFTCGLAPLCPGEGPMVFLFKNSAWTTDDIDRARCMATAMRDRTPGQLIYQDQEDDDFHTLEILGEQVVVVDEYHGIGFGFEYYEIVTTLKPPEFFADCATGPAVAVHKCLSEGFTRDCVDTQDCPN